MAFAIVIAVLLLGPIAVGSGVAVLRFYSGHAPDGSAPRTDQSHPLGGSGRPRRRALPPAA